jgi:hypothetical protein
MSWRLALLALPLAMQLAAANAIAAELQLGSTWARATPPGAAAGAIYLCIENGSTKSDRLLKLKTDVARMREVAVLD